MNILSAYQLAARLHAGQKDKAGRPYIDHLAGVFIRTMRAQGDRSQQIAALLHEAIENGKASAEDLLAAGVPQASVDLVKILTRDPSQDYMHYLAAVKAVPRAALVKVADLDDMMEPKRLAALDVEVAESLGRRYRCAFEFMHA
ncbi:HD domain-containing protein [Hydrogenophaga defluvii]|uniref:HD domain-containing protein n=1 Tax=Hydrogenophaga defluvii TaxID=249410 RepID=A0ABW2SGA2_9BURK